MSFAYEQLEAWNPSRMEVCQILRPVLLASTSREPGRRPGGSRSFAGGWPVGVVIFVDLSHFGRLWRAAEREMSGLMTFPQI